MCLDKGTYRTVRRHAMSEETPASIKTNRPNPEPVPALPGSLSAIVVIVFRVDMAMRSAAAATAAVVSLRRLLLLHLPRLLFSRAPVQYSVRCVQVFGGGIVFLEQKTRPALRSRQLHSRCFAPLEREREHMQWRELCRVRNRHSSSSHAAPHPHFFSVM
jgi:hypothetical protein